MNSTTWIDLTDIWNWSGQHGGIQRVVYGITKHYYLASLADGKISVRYFVFVPSSGNFHEVSFEEVYTRVELEKTKATTSSELDLKSRKERVKRIFIRYMPSQIKNNQRVKRHIKLVAIRLFAVLRRIRGVIRNFVSNRLNKKSQVGATVQFKKNDTVLILGKPWDNLAIQTKLTLEKQKYGFKLAQVVYDLIIPLYPHLHSKDLFNQYTKHMFEVVSASDILFPISKSSERDLFHFSKRLALKTPQTHVIRLGDDIVANKAEDTQQSLVKQKPYENLKQNNFILTVGTVEIRKNHTLLYYAYKLAEKQGIELPQLIIVGSSGWLSHDIQYLINNDPAMKNKITILNNVSDAGLQWLYENCLLTVYPSMYEGWGLPIAESLSYGKVCIASNTSSMPEIAGDLVQYHSPYDPSELLKLLQKYLTNDKLRIQKEKVISQNYKSTTWEQTYKQVKKYLES